MEEAGQRLEQRFSRCKGSKDPSCDCEGCGVLNLSSIDLPRVPELIDLWPGICKLYLDYNELEFLPPELFVVLRNLQVLSLVGNDVGNLPDTINQASDLQELYCNENLLKTLPDTFSQLSQLRVLNVVGNQLKCLPSDIENLSNLEKLHADENQLHALPEAFGLLSRLQVLELETNEIAVLPRSFGRLGLLKVLNLSSNKLSELPENFSELESLEILDLSKNDLKCLPTTMKCCRSLKKLYGDNNVITDLPPWVGNLPALEEIEMKNNQLKNEAIPKSFGPTSKQCRVLNLAGNFMTSMPDSIGELESLEKLHFGSVIRELERRNFQNGNWIHKIPESFGSLVNLRSVNLEENQIQELPESFGQLVNMDYLDLGQNQLYELPSSFGNLRSLRVCKLSKNHVELLPPSFGGLCSLEDLRLDHNQLAELPSSFGQLAKLKTLDLFNNRLNEFPTCVESLHNLVRMDIERNNIDLLSMDTPKLQVQSKYAERDQNLKDNWRGRNRRDLYTVSITKVERLSDESDVSAESDEDPAPTVEYNESVLKNAAYRNLSIWRSHNGPATRETSRYYGNSMVMHNQRANLTKGNLDYKLSEEGDEEDEDESSHLDKSASSDLDPGSLPSSTAGSTTQDTPQFTSTEDWDDEIDNSVPIDPDNPYGTALPAPREDLYQPGPVEYRFVGHYHMFLPSCLHANHVVRARYYRDNNVNTQQQQNTDQFLNTDGTPVDDERTNNAKNNSADVTKKAGNTEFCEEGQFDDVEEDS